MNLYLDTSALVKLYWWEEDAATVRRAVRRAKHLATARVAWSEMLATVARKRREGVPAKTCARVTASFRSDWQDLTIVSAFEAVGSILVIAMLVTPGCTGYLLSDRFGRMMAIAVGTAVASTVAGIYVSFYRDASTAACIVLAQAAVFAVALVFAPKHGLLAQRRRAAQT